MRRKLLKHLQMPPLRGTEVRKFFYMLKTELIVRLENLHCVPGAVLETLHTVLHFIITQTLPSRRLCPALLKRNQNLGSATARGCRDWKQRLEASAPLCLSGSSTQPLGHPGTPTLCPPRGRWKERLAGGQLI